MSSPNTKPPPQMGFIVPPANPEHGYANPLSSRTSPEGTPYPTNPQFQPAIPAHSTGPYPQPGGPYPSSYPHGGPYPPSEGPYPPSGGPYPPFGGPYPPVGSPYPSGDPQYPSSNEPSYPGSPGFNTSGDPLVTGFKPDGPGQPSGDYFPKDDPTDPLSMEGGNNKALAFSDKTIRRQFIKKVYAILMVQLLVTFGFVALCLFHQGIKRTVRHNMALMYTSIAVSLISLIPMVCCECARRTYPTNFIFLSIFTVAQAFMVGMVTTVYDVDSVVIAIGITSVVCLSLTIFAFQTKYDFTACGGVLLTMLICLVLFGIIAIFFPGDTMRLVYGVLGAMVFSFYLIFDTQLMMGGEHKVSISPEEYIFAALNIYLDVINLFLYILMAVGKRN